MSNSRAFASNQRPNKTTPSRGACASPPLSSPLYVPLPSLEFFVTLHAPPSPFSRAPQTSSFPQVSLAFSTLTTIRRQRLRRLTSPRRARATPDAGKRVLHPPSYLAPLLSARAFAHASALSSASLICARWKSRERDLPAAMLTKYSRILPAIAGLSASMCIFT